MEALPVSQRESKELIYHSNIKQPQGLCEHQDLDKFPFAITTRAQHEHGAIAAHVTGQAHFPDVPFSTASQTSQDSWVSSEQGKGTSQTCPGTPTAITDKLVCMEKVVHIVL